jgi:two-component system phosphate regulon sensor histidine kinase PhoR
MSQDNTSTDTAKVELLSFILHHAPAGIIVVDGEMRITNINPVAEKLTGYTREEALGRTCGEVFHCRLCGPDCPLPDLAAREVDKEEILHNRAGEQTPILLSGLALRDEQGELKGGALIFRDMSPFKRLDEERRHLVNMFAHDLKTPVVGMGGLVRRLREGKAGPLSGPQQAYLETIDKEMHRLEKLITDFLEFARLDLHILTPLPSAVQVEEECQEVMTLLSPLAEAKNIKLSAEFPGEVLVLQADPLLLRRVLENLLENAIKYSPSGATVVLKVAGEGNEVRFVVRDQGPGIPPEDLPHLFEFFHRGAAAGNERGFGLGLATVKRIIDAHGGRIRVESKPGHGSAFYFSLPWERPS